MNLFDTGQASRLLQLPSAGLAHLLDTLCAFKADKRFALADWRLRPLSSDMAHYARCDTHYLLHAYDRVRDLLRRAPAPQLPPPDGDVAGGAADAPYGGGGGPSTSGAAAPPSCARRSIESEKLDGPPSGGAPGAPPCAVG